MNQRWHGRWLPGSTRSVAWLAILVVLAISVLDLVGWMLDITPLKSIKPEWTSMRAVTAVCLALSALGLALLQKGPSGLVKLAVVQVPGILVGLVGLLTVALYAVALVTGQAPDLGGVPVLSLFLGSATRMALLTAILFVLIACVLVLLATGNRRAAAIAHALMLPGAMASYLVPISYLLGVQSLHEWMRVPVALHTGIAFCALSVAIFCVRPDTWLMEVLAGDHAGGAMARRLLPGLLLIPVVIGWLRLHGERAGAFKSEVGVALVAVTYTVCFMGLVWLSARSVNRTDEKRRAAEQAVRESAQRYRSLFNGMTEGFALHEIICDAKGEPCDYRFLEINPAFERLTGLKREDVEGKVVSQVLPNNDPIWVEKYGEVALTGQSVHFEHYATPLKRHYEVFAYCPAPRQFAVLFMDITARKHAEESLRRTAEELARSNKDLEQFAYVASHDLQEPLRMVTGFVELLEKECQGALTADACTYIAYAVDGARRMRTLIDDLLTFSRVTTRAGQLEATRSEEVLEEALAALHFAIQEAGATVTHGVLPTVRADATQLAQVFQNLVGNAVKFRGAEPPRVHVEARREEGHWLFSVRDNGIGIDPEFRDRIFLIFQRLHTRREYPGTGIGLALCKKIVERHGGRLWVESEPGRGSTFFFTLPA